MKDKLFVISLEPDISIEDFSTKLSNWNSFVKPFGFVVVPFSKVKLFEIDLQSMMSNLYYLYLLINIYSKNNKII